MLCGLMRSVSTSRGEPMDSTTGASRRVSRVGRRAERAETPLASESATTSAIVRVYELLHMDGVTRASVATRGTVSCNLGAWGPSTPLFQVVLPYARRTGLYSILYILVFIYIMCVISTVLVYIALFFTSTRVSGNRASPLPRGPIRDPVVDRRRRRTGASRPCPSCRAWVA